MFKYLSAKDEDPGFPNAVVITNCSEHWLQVDDAGRRIPPRSHAAMDSLLLAQSTHIEKHITSGLISIASKTNSRNTTKPKRRKKTDEPKQEVHNSGSVVANSEESASIVSDGTATSDNTNLVAEPEHENWVSSTENIVGEPTPDHI